jgi:hypothetical protein
MALAKQHGVVIHTMDDEVNLEAPTGYVFGDVHELIHSPADAEVQKDMWRRAYDDLRAQLPYLGKCSDEECEWCEEGRALIGDKD